MNKRNDNKAKEPKIIAKKWEGDDRYSWAVFINGQSEPFVSGIDRNSVSYYKNLALQSWRESRYKNSI